MTMPDYNRKEYAVIRLKTTPEMISELKKAYPKASINYAGNAEYIVSDISAEEISKYGTIINVPVKDASTEAEKKELSFDSPNLVKPTPIDLISAGFIGFGSDIKFEMEKSISEMRKINEESQAKNEEKLKSIEGKVEVLNSNVVKMQEIFQGYISATTNVLSAISSK